jgi:hypothetical protein
VPIDYRYHIGSFVAIFLALLLGILIGIGLAPNPQELDQVVSGLKDDYRKVSESKEAELIALREGEREAAMLTRQTVAALIAGRLQGKRIAIVVDHDFGGDPLPDTLRGTLKDAGATVVAMMVLTRDFVTLPPKVKQRVGERLSLYPPPGVYVRTVIAEAIAQDLARGGATLILDLQSSGLLKSAADSDYTVRPDVVLVVGGAAAPEEIAPERIDLPMIRKLTALGLRVVGVEPRSAVVSVIPLYKAAGIATVDNADTAAGRLSTVIVLAGAEGHYGVKDTADSFLPAIPQPVRR